MKRLFSIICILCMLFTFGCSNDDELESTPPMELDFGASSEATPLAQAPETIANDDETERENAPAQTRSGTLSLGTPVTYAFDGMLYGAVEVTNTASENIVLTEATFSFTVGGESYEETFTPVMGEYDVLAPNQSAYCTLFLPTAELLSGTAVTLEVDVLSTTTDRRAFTLTVKDTMLIENYHTFATLSGELMNPTATTCDLNMIQVGFYDDADNFLGAWYFTKNAVLTAGQSKPFVVHLKELPIPDLAANCATIRARAFGI